MSSRAVPTTFTTVDGDDDDDDEVDKYPDGSRWLVVVAPPSPPPPLFEEVVELAVEAMALFIYFKVVAMLLFCLFCATIRGAETAPAPAPAEEQKCVL